MKKLLILMLLPLCAKPANYYFSATGSDANPGTKALPWQTQPKFVSVFNAANPGDSLLLKRGDVFKWTGITLGKSGTSSAPIVISAYGTGNKPVFDASNSVTSWVSLGGGVYESTNAVSTLSSLSMVTLNNLPMAMGRYPKYNAANQGYIKYTGGSNGSISAPLSGVPSFVGGEAVIRFFRWSIDRCTVTGQSSTTVSYTPQSGYSPNGGFGLFFQNHPSTLTQAGTTLGEWYYNPSTKKLRMFFGNALPSAYNVKVSAVSTMLSASSKNYIHIDNLNIYHCNAYAVSITSGIGDIIKNCDISNTGDRGILLNSCTSTSILTNNIKWSLTGGIDGSFVGDNLKIIGNSVTNSEQFAGMAWKKSMDDADNALRIVAKNSDVSYNYIKGAGFMGLRFQLSSATNNTIVHHNYIDSTCFVKDDAGGLYCYSNAGLIHTGNKMLWNIVANSIGAPAGTSSSTPEGHGIYCDYTSDHMEVAYNTIINASQRGIFLNDNRSQYVHDNTTYNCKWGLRITNGNSASDVSTGLNIKKNIWFALTAAQTTGSFKSYFRSSFTSFGTFDSNWYCRPILETNSIHYEPTGAKADITLAQWKTYGQDAHSKTTGVTITSTSQVALYYNASSAPRTYTLTAGAVDPKGVTYSGNLTLQPYESRILIFTGTADNPPVDPPIDPPPPPTDTTDVPIDTMPNIATSIRTMQKILVVVPQP